MTMENNYKSYCELIFTSGSITPEMVTKMTKLVPYRSFKKNETFYSRPSGTEGIRRQNLWAIKSDVITTEEEDVSIHLSFFKRLLNDKIEIFQKLKNDKTNEICFWIWIETNNIGVGLEIDETDLYFIYNISNRLHLSVVSALPLV
jgi:hypothetical protein